MIQPRKISLLIGLLLLSSSSFASEVSQHIIHHISDAKNSIEKLENGNYCKTRKCVFITFWDFDGTILKGDCSEGFEENNQAVYAGLAQRAIEAGLSKKYGKQDFQKFWNKYKQSEKKSHESAYSFLTTAFEGTRYDDLVQFSEGYFQSDLKKYIFKDSLEIINELKKQNIVIHVVSASPEYFVKGSASTGVTPKENIDGIQVRLNQGIVSNQVLAPITYAQGKVVRIKKILTQMQKEQKTKAIFVLGGFGNSFPTDADFLEFIKNKSLPAGQPISTMINGSGKKGRFEKMFFDVSFN